MVRWIWDWSVNCWICCARYAVFNRSVWRHIQLCYNLFLVIASGFSIWIVFLHSIWFVNMHDFAWGRIPSFWMKCHPCAWVSKVAKVRVLREISGHGGRTYIPIWRFTGISVTDEYMKKANLQTKKKHRRKHKKGKRGRHDSNSSEDIPVAHKVDIIEEEMPEVSGL